MKNFARAFLLTLISAGSVNASDSSSGCGLGWEVTQKQSILSSAVRSTTHAVLPNTFSMTFGTSGCTKHSIVKNEQEQIYFVEANLEQLSLEIAQGDGEYLRSFAGVMGCESEYAAFSELLQNNYGTLFSDRTSPASLLRGVKAGIGSHSRLSRACASTT